MFVKYVCYCIIRSKNAIWEVKGSDNVVIDGKKKLSHVYVYRKYVNMMLRNWKKKKTKYCTRKVFCRKDGEIKCYRLFDNNNYSTFFIDGNYKMQFKLISATRCPRAHINQRSVISIFFYFFMGEIRFFEGAIDFSFYWKVFWLVQYYSAHKTHIFLQFGTTIIWVGLNANMWAGR